MPVVMRGIVKTYQMGHEFVTVLDGVSLEVGKGEFIALLGPSGSGKSTLMNIMGCIDVADSGEYFLAGENIREKDDNELAVIRNRKIGFIFQQFLLLPKYTALQNVQLPLLLRGMERMAAEEEARKILEMVGLGHRLHHKPNELSGGQQQRVSIARALVGKPEILLADEPTGNLDSKVGHEIMDMFAQLNDEGNTIVMITHDQEIARHAKRIIHIRDGKICT